MRANWLTTPITVNGRNFYQTSCRMTTDTKQSFQYGRIEARMALPTATGSWPAFWMLGDSCDETSTSAYNPAQTITTACQRTGPVAVRSTSWNTRTRTRP